MSFLSPWTALIAAGVVIPPLVALYFLKLRRREVVISSTLLWRRAVQDLEVNAPFQKLKRNLLLLLQLLALLALLLAAGRPAWEARADPGQRVVIVVDRSGSMNASAGDGTRFDAAKREAISLLEAVGSSDDGRAGEAMVIAFDGRAQVVQPFTTNLSQAKRAVEALRPSDGGSRLADALRLIRPFTRQAAAGQPVTVHVVSDGRVGGDEPGDPAAGAADVSLPNVEVTFVRIGQPGEGDAAWPDNVAIVAASARRDYERPQRVRVFAQVANLGPNPASCRLALRIDGRVVSADAVALPAARPITVRDDGTVDVPAAPTQSVRFAFDLPGQGLITLSHDAAATTGDALPADDTAHLVLAPAKRLRVLLVSPGNDFLLRAIRAAGAEHIERVEPAAYEALDPADLVRAGPEAGYDVIVFDRHSPSAVPPVSGLYFAAAPPIEGLAVRRPAPAGEGGGGDGEDPPPATIVLDWRREHPLLQHVVMDDVVIAGAGRVVLPPRGVVLATGQRGPILAEVASNGLRHVIASFEIVGDAGLRTNWVKQVGFPVFVRNTVQVLGLGRLRDEAGIAYAPGDAAAVPAPPAFETLAYTGPRDLAAPVIDGRAVLPTFPLAGLYTTDAAVEPPFNRLAVNTASLRESDLRPAPKLTVGGTAAETRDGGGTVQKELWPWFVVPAIAVLMLEWFVWTRRVHL